MNNVIRIKKVQEITGLSRATIYRIMAPRGDFPASFPLTSGTVGWDEEEVRAWITCRKEKARQIQKLAFEWEGEG